MPLLAGCPSPPGCRGEGTCDGVTDGRRSCLNFCAPLWNFTTTDVQHCAVDSCNESLYADPDTLATLRACPTDSFCSPDVIAVGDPVTGLGTCQARDALLTQCARATSENPDADSCGLGAYCEQVLSYRVLAAFNNDISRIPVTDIISGGESGICFFPVVEGQLCDSNLADRLPPPRTPAVLLGERPCELGTDCVDDPRTAEEDPRCMRSCTNSEGANDPSFCDCDDALCVPLGVDVINEATGANLGSNFCRPCLRSNRGGCLNDPDVACCDGLASCNPRLGPVELTVSSLEIDLAPDLCVLEELLTSSIERRVLGEIRGQLSEQITEALGLVLGSRATRDFGVPASSLRTCASDVDCSVPMPGRGLLFGGERHACVDHDGNAATPNLCDLVHFETRRLYVGPRGIDLVFADGPDDPQFTPLSGWAFGTIDSLPDDLVSCSPTRLVFEPENPLSAGDAPVRSTLERGESARVIFDGNTPFCDGTETGAAAGSCLCRTAGAACGNPFAMVALGLNPPAADLTCQSGRCCLPPSWTPPMAAVTACATLMPGSPCSYGSPLSFSGSCTAQPGGLTCMPLATCAASSTP